MIQNIFVTKLRTISLGNSHIMNCISLQVEIIQVLNDRRDKYGSHFKNNYKNQGTFHALRPVDLRRGVSFSVGVAAWIQPKQYPLAYWRNRMQISTLGSRIFVPQVYASLQLWRTTEELLAYLRREFYMECTLMSFTWNAPRSIVKRISNA